MPIDQQLENLEDLPSKGKENNGIEKKILYGFQAPFMLPSNNIANLHPIFAQTWGKLNFSHYTTDEISTRDLLDKIKDIWPYREYLSNFAESMSNLSENLQVWSRSFRNIRELSAFIHNPKQIPPSLYAQIIDPIEEAFKKINSTELTIQPKSGVTYEILKYCNGINNNLVDLYNTSDLVDVNLLGHSILSQINKINGYYACPYWNWKKENPPNCTQFCDDIERLVNFAHGKTLISGYCNGGKLLNIQDHTSKPKLKKSFWRRK
ncbi:hypothetical protein J4471_00105 [Candidatus Woesearchaeota archaeon]|nr:hypothetical protein [Candidatus Woesearchaeota archaeon]